MSLPKFTSRIISIVVVITTMLFGFSTTVQAQPAGTDESLAVAQAAIAKRDWATAEGILQPLSKSQPNNPFVFYEMAQVYENTNRIEAAKQIYQGIATIPDAAQRQYTVVVRSPNVNYMTSLVGLSQAKLNALNASVAAKPAVVAQAVTPMPKAVPTLTAAPAVVSSTSAEVTAAMQNWAKAWANKDLGAYFASYVGGYQGDKANAAAWKKFRTNYISSKKTIGLDFADMQVTMLGADKAQMNFKQSYTSDSFKDVSNKTMNWVKRGNVWLIEKESTK
jgi:hypothetical protein